MPTSPSISPMCRAGADDDVAQVAANDVLGRETYMFRLTWVTSSPMLVITA